MPQERRQRIRSQYWCTTHNNYTEEHVQAWRELINQALFSYVVFGRELAPTTGTPHLQIYFELNQRRECAVVVGLLPARLHIERRVSTAVQAADYCKKDGDYEEFGQLSVSRQGSRTDLEQLREDLTSNEMTMLQVADRNFGAFLKYQRGIVAYTRLLSTRRDWETQCHVFWGETGTGKSRRVWQTHPDLYSHPEGKWFDMYTGQEVALFDEFNGTWFKISYLLKLLDRYPMTVEVKGGHVEWKPKIIYLVSNINPEEWYTNITPQQQAALRRRFTSVTHFNDLMNQ